MTDKQKGLLGLIKAYGISSVEPMESSNGVQLFSGLLGKHPIVLKASCDTERLAREAAALRVFNGHGAVPILAEESGFLIMERVLPGTTLGSYFPDQDEMATSIVCALIEKLHKAPQTHVAQFPHLSTLLETFDKDWPLSESILGKARQKRDMLCATSSGELLLHGDLHHGNILADKESWCAIDPMGFVGESIYEVTAFIRNPVPDLLAAQSPDALIQKRIAICVERFNVPRARIADWLFVSVVLALGWTIEDLSTDEAYFRRLVKLLDELFFN